MEFRNIAIIAHVDHGKTTLVDAMLRQSGTFSDREDVVECVMDSNELERERGITIYAKNAAVVVDGVKINIVDTPGHADFGSEVERVLRMVDSVLLLVDAAEGPMPQTKFVLRKSLALGLKPIVIVNKIDKPNARPDEALNAVFDLFVELGASDAQLDFRHIYAIGRDGVAMQEIGDERKDLRPLFDCILREVPAAQSDISQPFRMQIANLAYDAYIGRMGIGRVVEGVVHTGDRVTVIHREGGRAQGTISKILNHYGLKTIEAKEGVAGDIIRIAGIPTIDVGDTVAIDPKAEALPVISVDAPTLTMTFAANTSPFAGKEGKFLTSRHIRERLLRELETNVGLQVAFPDGDGEFVVSGRGELHISVLIEQMRREGFELQIGRPKVIVKEEGGEILEPMEQVVVDVPDESAGTVIEALGKRRGEMQNMISRDGSTRLEYVVPTRGLLGYRTEFLTSTKGEGTLAHNFSHHAPYRGELGENPAGAIISGFTGVATAYALESLQERGMLFINPTVQVYEGMVIGASAKESMTVNPIKEKKLSNMRAASAEDLVHLTPPLDVTLERALGLVKEDELVEVTPSSIRLRKKILDENARKRADR